MDALQVRAAAAHDLARKGLLDGALALSYVLWPTEAVAAASEAVAAEGGLRGRHSEGTRLRAMELVDAGCSWAEAARLVGVPKGTLGTWVRKRQRGVAWGGDDSQTTTGTTPAPHLAACTAGAT